jgi:hypothetical protein
VMEGTRLMLTRAETVAPGYQFTIHTPGTPARWRQYDEELEALFTRLQEVAFGADGGSYSGASASVGASGDTPGGVAGGDPTDASDGAVGVEAGSEEEVLVELAMTFFFYWVNFGPLSRGSAATGYAVRHLISPLCILVHVNIQTHLPTMHALFSAGLVCAPPLRGARLRRQHSDGRAAGLGVHPLPDTPAIHR